MLNNSENPANAEMPIVINTPGWVKGLFVFFFKENFYFSSLFFVILFAQYTIEIF